MDTKKTSLAVATFFAVLSLICALAIAIVPELSKSLFGLWFHGIDLETIWNTSNISFIRVIYGLISSFVSAYIATWLFVVIYKVIVKK